MLNLEISIESVLNVFTKFQQSKIYADTIII